MSSRSLHVYLSKEEHKRLRDFSLICGASMSAVLRRSAIVYFEQLDAEAVKKEREHYRNMRKR